MRLPWKRKELPKRRYVCIDAEWRQHWFRVNSWRSQGETCQCEIHGDTNDRSGCHIHGPTGRELYEELRR